MRRCYLAGYTVSRRRLPKVVVTPPTPPEEPPSDGTYATGARVTVDVSYPNNNGTVWQVASGDVPALRDAFANAAMGDIIELEEGGEWTVTSAIAMDPRTRTSSSQYIWVRPSNWAAIRAAYPTENDGMPTDAARKNAATNPRMTPSRAAALNLPKIYTAYTQTITGIKANTAGWYFSAIDFGISPTWAAANPSTYQYIIVGPDYDELTAAKIASMDAFPKDIIFNQCLVRCPPLSMNGKAAALNINNHAFVNGYCESHHRDSENASLWMAYGKGPFRWENNAVVGASITAFIGGVHFSESGHPYMVGEFPKDGTIKYNYFHTPDEWLPGHPANTIGNDEDKKNLFEWKLGGYMTVYGNILSGSRTGSQNGQGFTIKVLNEAYSGGYTYGGPMWWSETHDLLIKHNLSKNTGDAIDILGNQQTGGHPTLDNVCEGTQINRLHITENLFLCGDSANGYQGTTGRFGLWQAWLESDARRGRKKATWKIDNNIFATQSPATFGVGVYVAGQWDDEWPKIDNNLFSAVNFRHFSADSSGSSAQVIKAKMPGVVLEDNIFGKLSSGDNEFNNSHGDWETGNTFVNGNTALGLNPATGQIDPSSPYYASHGGIYDAVMDATSGLEFWE